MTGGDYVFLTAMMNPLGAPDLVKEFGGEGTVGTVLHEAFRSLLVVTVDAHGGGASTENFISEVERSAYGVGNLQAGYQQVMSACTCVCVCVCVCMCVYVCMCVEEIYWLWISYSCWVISHYNVQIAPHFASDIRGSSPCTYSFLLVIIALKGFHNFHQTHTQSVQISVKGSDRDLRRLCVSAQIMTDMLCQSKTI